MFEFMQSSCMDSCGWADNKVKQIKLNDYFLLNLMVIVPAFFQMAISEEKSIME